MAQERGLEVLERRDIQGVILRAYPEFREARYYLLEIHRPTTFKAWLSKRLENGEITTALERPDRNAHAANIAFTTRGLRKLGVDPDPCKQHRDGFSLEFREGLTMPSRSRILGDVGPNDPAGWVWGSTDDTNAASECHIDCLLLMFAMHRDDAPGSDQPPIERLADRLLPDQDVAQVVHLMCAHLTTEGREPFGFRDGISQPIIRFTKRDYDTIEPRRSLHLVEPGEFILGYENQQGDMPLSPSVTPERDARGRLQPLEKRPRVDPRPFRKDLRDFGRNGTYLVMRQLRQHVEAFDDFLRTTAGPDEHQQRALAAKMIGRWQNGRPLTLSPDEDRNRSDENDFSYFSADRFGYRCPMGAHIRRGNPRDATTAIDGRTAALHRSNRHRLLRRGRVYGPPDGEAGERGLIFICLNSDIRLQFEFVQQTWMMSNKFGGLLDERDPLVGGGPFTIQQAEGHREIPALPTFVTVKGGAYFFMPGLAALHCLADPDPEGL